MGWIEQLLLGRVGTIVAILAVAGVGFALLQGRLAIRDGIRVVLGCFILFGAPIIARGLADLARPQAQIGPVQQVEVPSAPPSPPPSPAQNPDPYAGAAVPIQ